ncbi:MAG: hypothetical protein SNI51_04220 [Rikenellaceae bacterium]
MKKIYIAIIALLTFSMNSCETYEGALTPNEFSDYAFVCSGYTSGSTELNYIDLNSVISFIDLSKGSLAHYWEISDGCSFVTSDYKNYGSDNYDSVLIDGSVNTDETVHIFFKEEGEHTVVLSALFDEYVTYQPKEGGEIYESYYSEELGGYVIRTEFNFLAFGDVNAAYTIYKSDGTEVLSRDLDDNIDETYGSITITEGDYITLVFDEIVSSPNTFTYNFNNGSPEIVETLGEDGMPAMLTVTYREPGSAYSMGSILLQRTAEGDFEEMTASKVSLSIPLFVTVEDMPYTSSPIKAVEDTFTATSNSLTFALESLNKLYIEDDVVDDFVLIVNNSAVDVVDKLIPITSVELSADYKSITLLFEGDMLYANDEITLSYSGDGVNDSKSTNLTAFDNLSVGFYESVIDRDYYGFETSGASWKSSKTPDAWSYSDEQVSSGSYSMKYSNTEAYAGNTFNKSSDQYMITTEFSQTYTLKFKAFVTEDSVINDTVGFIFYTTWTYTKVYDTNMTALSNFEKGKWIDVEITFTNGAAANNTNLAEDDSIQIGLLQPDVCTIYFDEIDMAIQSSRPTEN